MTAKLYGMKIYSANCLQKYPIIPKVTAKYTGREGQQFSKQEVSKFFLFHGSPDIIIKKIKDEENIGIGENVIVIANDESVADEERAAEDERAENDEIAADDEIAMVADYEITTDNVGVIENKTHRVDTNIINNVTIPEEISEALANIHIVSVKNFLDNISKGNGSTITNTTIRCNGAFLSKILGACYCEVVMPLTEPLIDAESESWNKSSLLGIKLTSSMHEQLGKHNLCCHLNKLFS